MAGLEFCIKTMSATVLATMWSMWVRSLIRLSFCLRNFYGYLRGLRQRGHDAFHEASLSYSKDPPKTAAAGSMPLGPSPRRPT